jgi:hypothetical protein
MAQADEAPHPLVGSYLPWTHAMNDPRSVASPLPACLRVFCGWRAAKTEFGNELYFLDNLRER